MVGTLLKGWSFNKVPVKYTLGYVFVLEKIDDFVMKSKQLSHSLVHLINIFR